MWDESRLFPIELRDVDDARRIMRGVAAPYNQPTPIAGQYIEVLAPGLFAKSIRESAANLPLLTFHDQRAWPVGKATGWEETPDALIGTWQFANTEEGVKAWGMARDGFMSGLSVGFQPIKSDVSPGGDTIPPTVTRREARMFETSMVPAPAYVGAQVLMVRTAGVRRNTPHLDAWRRWTSTHQ